MEYAVKVPQQGIEYLLDEPPFENRDPSPFLRVGEVHVDWYELRAAGRLVRRFATSRWPASACGGDGEGLGRDAIQNERNSGK